MKHEVKKRITLYIIRAIFFACSIGLGLYISESIDPHTLRPQEGSLNPLYFMLGGAILSAGIILVEIFFSKSSIANISSIVFGLLIGFITSYLFVGVISLIVEDLSADKQALSYLNIISMLIFCYFGITVLLQTQDDFRFIIPYVEFSKDVRGIQPLILDTSVIIDGRIAELGALGIFDNRIIVSRFVVDELQKLADSADKQKRVHGRRGLDILNRLKEIDLLSLEFSYEEIPDVKEVDHKLLQLTQKLQGKVVTNDYNLNKVANIYDIKVININDIAQAVQAKVMPGDEIGIQLVREGESPNQAVGFLNDGTLVVVDNGRDKIGEKVTATIRNIHQTSAGRMIFAALKSPHSSESDEDEPSDDGDNLPADKKEESDSPEKKEKKGKKGKKKKKR